MPSANVNGTEGQCLELLVPVSGYVRVPSSEEERGDANASFRDGSPWLEWPFVRNGVPLSVISKARRT